MGTDDKLGESTDDIKSPGNPLRQSGQGGNHMNTVRSLGLMHDLQEYIVTVEAISAKRKAEIDRLKEANRDMERLLKMNKQAARRKEGSANESPTLAGPKTGFGDIANQDIPPKVRKDGGREFGDPACGGGCGACGGPCVAAAQMWEVSLPK